MRASVGSTQKKRVLQRRTVYVLAAVFVVVLIVLYGDRRHFRQHVSRKVQREQVPSEKFGEHEILETSLPQEEGTQAEGSTSVDPPPEECNCCERCTQCSKCMAAAVSTLPAALHSGLCYEPVDCTPQKPRKYTVVPCNATKGATIPLNELSDCDCTKTGFLWLPVRRGCDHPRYASLLGHCLDHRLPAVPNITVASLVQGATLLCYTQGDVVCETAIRTGQWEATLQQIILSALNRLKHRRARWTTNSSRGSLQRTAQRNVHFIDVGANVGILSFNQFANGYMVHSIEALPSNVQLLKMSNCIAQFERSNALRPIYPNQDNDNSVEIIHAALSAEPSDEPCEMISQPSNFGDAHVVCNHSDLQRYLSHGYESRGSVPVITLDQIVRQWDHNANDDLLPDAPPSFAHKDYIMKIDVEGNEGAVMEGSQWFLSQPFRPKLIVSEVWKRTNLTRYAEVMYSSGYVVFSDERRGWIESLSDFAEHVETSSVEIGTLFFVLNGSTELLDRPERKKWRGSKRKASVAPQTGL